MIFNPIDFFTQFFKNEHVQSQLSEPNVKPNIQYKMIPISKVTYMIFVQYYVFGHGVTVFRRFYSKLIML